MSLVGKEPTNFTLKKFKKLRKSFYGNLCVFLNKKFKKTQKFTKIKQEKSFKKTIKICIQVAIKFGYSSKSNKLILCHIKYLYLYLFVNTDYLKFLSCIFLLFINTNSIYNF